MQYPDGQRVALGDIIELYPGICGQVVCSLDDKQFSSVCSEPDWAHLEKGILIKSDKGGIVHFEQPEASFKLCRRGYLPANPAKPQP